MAENSVLESRFTTLLGDEGGLEYRYSNKTNVSRPFPQCVEQQRARLGELVRHDFNVALCNYYKDGAHAVSWHSDSEEDLVPGAVIATLSFGATRTFQLRSMECSSRLRLRQELCERLKREERAPTPDEQLILADRPLEDDSANLSLELADGDALIMGGTLQQHWRHRVPRVKGQPEVYPPRIVMTFRCVATLEHDKAL